MFHVSLFPADRDFARRLRAVTLTRPVWRHADDARSSFASSEASWAASRCLKSPLPVYATGHGNRSTMPPLYTNANVCRLFIRPSGEWSRAGMRYHNFTARRSEFGVAKSRFGRCSPIAWLSMSRMRVLRRAYAPASCGCTFFPVTKRCPGSSKETVSSGGSIPRLFWSHPYQSPRLRGSSHLWSPLPSAPPDCKDPGRLGPLPPVRPVWDEGFLSRPLNSVVVPMPCLSQGPQPHNERGARGDRAHMENVPPGA